MRTLVQKLWIPENRKTTVCVDSYQQGILQGWFYGHHADPQPFRSLSQFLVLMEDMLEQTNAPQADTAHRSFHTLLQQCSGELPPKGVRRGVLATFELQILFRQHSSWQGSVLWKEQHLQQHFRSVLELIFLLDSALRGEEKEVG